MAPRAIWKGFLKVGEVTCPVALHAAVSTSDRIAFHTINRATGHRVKRQFVDEETGKPVEGEDQVKGYEVSRGEYVMLEPDEVKAVVPQSDKTLAVESFIGGDEIDDVYLDRPYYMTPGSAVAEDTFALLREGMRAKEVAALARAVLFRRVRTLLVRPHEKGMVATTLHFDYEVRSAAEAFRDIPKIKIEGEMLDLAKHIISTKSGTFDPGKFDDRYEAAVAELVKAKLAGKPIEARKPPKAEKVIDLMEALRQSAGAARAPKARSPIKGKKATAKAKAKRKAASEATRRRKAS
jgi:DNA end-binding protein Ku